MLDKWKNFVNESTLSEASVGKVWVLTEQEYEKGSSTILGIFSSEESANEKMKEYFDKMMADRRKEYELRFNLASEKGLNKPSKQMLEPPEYMGYDVEEYDLLP